MIDIAKLIRAGEYGERTKKSIAWKFYRIAADEARWAAHLALAGCDYLADDDVMRDGLSLGRRSKVDANELST